MRPFSNGFDGNSEYTDLAREVAPGSSDGPIQDFTFAEDLKYGHPPQNTSHMMLFSKMLKGNLTEKECAKLFKSMATERYGQKAASGIFSDVSSESYYLNHPWNDADLLADIPELFTIDLTPSTGQESDILCECQVCREWVRNMHEAYHKPRFYVRTISDPDHLRFYKGREIPWPDYLPEDDGSSDHDDEQEPSTDSSSNSLEAEDEGSDDGESSAESSNDLQETGDEGSDEEEEPSTDSSSNPLEAEDEGGDHGESSAESSNDLQETEDKGRGILEVCKYSQALVMCLGRDEDLGVCTFANRLHVRINGASKGDTFHIRAYSPEDPSTYNFKPDIGAVIADPTCQDNWDQARAWLSECQRSHERCRCRDSQATSSDSWPTRLVDVGFEGDDTIKLTPNNELSSDLVSGGYLALSYCWGVGNQGTSTVTDNFGGRCVGGFPVKDQPQTIQDSIQTTRKLGFRLLWIDTLCIIQNDMADRNAEIAKMHLIYQQAKLLISAARAKTASDGFLHTVDDYTLQQYELYYAVPFRYRQDEAQGYVMLEKFDKRRLRSKGYVEPIHTRAWTMQEHLVSTRILAFGTTGVRWQCMDDMEYGPAKWSQFTNLSEVLSVSSHMNCRQRPSIDPQIGQVSSSRPSEEAAWKYYPRESSVGAEWNHLRGDYQCRRLTDQGDSLLAFSSVSRQFVRLLGSEQDYIAGHWRSQLPGDLLWHGDETRARPAPFPSWSWASHYSIHRSNAASNFFDPDKKPLSLLQNNPRTHPYRGWIKEVARVLETDVDLKDPRNPFGDVRSARLIMSGRLLPVTLNIKEEQHGYGEQEDIQYEIESAEITPSTGIPPVISDAESGFDSNLDGYYKRFWPQGNLNRTANHYLLEIIQYPPWDDSSASSKGLILESRQCYTSSWGECGEFTRIGTFELDWLSEREWEGDEEVDEEVDDTLPTREHRNLFDYEQDSVLTLI